MQVKNATRLPNAPTRSTSSAASSVQDESHLAIDERLSRPTSQALTSHSTLQPELESSEPADELSVHEQHDSTPMSSTLFDVSEIQALYDRKAAEISGLSWASDLANAVAAVDSTDVLTEDAPFASSLLQV